MNFPNFLILGECKCGTTSMYDNLVKHPDILPSLGNGEDLLVDADVPLGVKEVRFFDKYYSKGWDWYKSRFPECKKGQITGEASPTYLYKSLSIYRMKEILKDTKLIVMLRNPVDRLISHYGHNKKINPSWRQKYPTMDVFWNTCVERDYHLIQRGDYHRSLNNLFNILGEEREVLILRSEYFFKEPQAIYSFVLDHLGVKDMKLDNPSHSRKGLKQEDINCRKEIEEFYSDSIKRLEDEHKVNLW